MVYISTMLLEMGVPVANTTTLPPLHSCLLYTSNPKLEIDGILLTMVDNRTNFAQEIAALLRETYGSKIKVFGTEIPHSVRAKAVSYTHLQQ